MLIRRSVQPNVLSFAFVLFAILSPIVLAVEESIVLTTYYPSPYGVYNEMRLYPHHPYATPCDKTQEGLMYYDDSPTEHALKICMCKNPPLCDTFDWMPASGYWTLLGADLYPNDPSWNVGIGTTSPNAKLHVSGDIRIPYNGKIKFGNTDAFIDGGGGEWISNTSPDGSTDFGLKFIGGSQERMRITANNGNVGIGTMNPGTNKLEVAGTAQLRGAAGGTGLYVDPSGNVGIGTTAPWATLHIVGSPTVVSDRTLLALDGGGSRDAAVYLNAVGADGVTANGIIESSAVGGHGGFTTEPEGIFLCAYQNNDINQGSRIRLIGNPITFENGNVGIGSGAWNPGWLFHVSGDAAKPGGGSWTDSSDIRLKKNIAPLAGALEKVLQLRGVTFEWNEPEHAKLLPGTQIGMIGQEVEKVFPGWVGTDANGYKDLTMRGFEALSIEAMRELKTENDALKARVDELEKRIKLIEAR